MDFSNFGIKGINLQGIHTTTGVALFILAVVIAVAITTKSSASNAKKSREEWRALPAEQKTGPAMMVNNSPSSKAIAVAIIGVLIIAYVIVKGGM